MRIGLVLGVIGNVLRVFALAFVPPFLMALSDGMFDDVWDLAWSADDLEESARFAVTGITTWVAGTLLARGMGPTPVFRRAEALAVVAGTWMLLGVFASIPYVFNGIPVIDSLFESISGLTTTGATILEGDMWEQSRAFFLWRAMTQWFGGLGVIALFVVVLPRLGIAGRQIFFAESSSAPGEAVAPSVRKSARKLWMFYVGLTLLMTTLLTFALDGSTLSSGAAAGPYEALIHSLTTLSAGGFSNDPSSILGFTDSASAEWIFVAFMFVAGASYPLMWIAVTRNPLVLLRDGEFRLYAVVALLASLAIAALLAGGLPGEEALRIAAFQVSSLISSAGFASANYELWSPGLKGILVVVMIMGGCAGSAAGGAKEIRFLLVFKFLRRELTRVLHPRAVLPLRHGGEPVPNRVMWAIFLLVLLYLIGYVAFAIPLLLLGERAGAAPLVEIETAFSASLACLSNVGPAFGFAGPMGSYADFHPVSKLLLTFEMLIGRLEIVTILALLQWEVWRGLRWGARIRRAT